MCKNDGNARPGFNIVLMISFLIRQWEVSNDVDRGGATLAVNMDNIYYNFKV